MDIKQIAAILLQHSQIAVRGTTTGAGAGTGKSFFDATLIGVDAGSFISMLAILYPGQPTKVDSMAITAFTTGSGEVALARAYKGVAAPIPAGVPYIIVTFRFVAADVASLTANVGDASASALGSLYAILGNPSVSLNSKVNHIPKFTGNLWWVSTTGDNADDGKSPEMAFLTIDHAITTAAPGDRIYVKAGTYDEVITMNKVGLELVCEQGTILVNTTPGTPLVVGPADYQRVVGAILAEAGEIGIQITGSFCSFEDSLAFGSSVGFDDDGDENHFENCRSILHTVTGFDISAGYGQYERCIAAGGAAAVTGVLLSDAAADHNHFFDCHTLGNATRGWDVVANADNNMFSHCSTGAGDVAKRDLGTNNTWDEFSEGSQIVAGQTRDQDLADIFNRLGLPAGASLAADLATIAAYIDTEIVAIITSLGGTTGIFHGQADVAVNINATLASETDVLHLTAADTRYIVRSLRLKSADPNPNTVIVRLKELVNDGLVTVDSFDITNANFATYHSLMDMFGLPHLAGDELQVTVQVSAGGDIAVTGQYSYGKTNV